MCILLRLSLLFVFLTHTVRAADKKRKQILCIAELNALMQRLQPRFTLMVQFRQFIEFQLVDTAELLEFFFLPPYHSSRCTSCRSGVVSVKNNFNAEIEVPVLLKSSPGDVRALSH